MIVELIGSAGAGKTTLRRLLCDRGIRGHDVVAMPDLALDRALLRRITHPTAINFVQELRGLPFFLGAFPREREFIAFARSMLWRHRSTFERLNGLRGIVRKVGMYHLAGARAEGTIVLSDEGTILSAYNLLVGGHPRVGETELADFARLVPLPDVVVHVRAPVETLVERATSRPDPRRQHVGKDAAAVEADIRCTVELFDALVTMPRFRGRVTTIESSNLDQDGRSRLADELAERLRICFLLGPQAARPEASPPLEGAGREKV